MRGKLLWKECYGRFLVGNVTGTDFGIVTLAFLLAWKQTFNRNLYLTKGCNAKIYICNAKIYRYI